MTITSAQFNNICQTLSGPGASSLTNNQRSDLQQQIQQYVHENIMPNIASFAGSQSERQQQATPQRPAAQLMSNSQREMAQLQERAPAQAERAPSNPGNARGSSQPPAQSGNNQPSQNAQAPTAQNQTSQTQQNTAAQTQQTGANAQTTQQNTAQAKAGQNGTQNTPGTNTASQNAGKLSAQTNTPQSTTTQQSSTSEITQTAKSTSSQTSTGSQKMGTLVLNGKSASVQKMANPANQQQAATQSASAKSGRGVSTAQNNSAPTAKAANLGMQLLGAAPQAKGMQGQPLALLGGMQVASKEVNTNTSTSKGKSVEAIGSKSTGKASQSNQNNPNIIGPNMANTEAVANNNKASKTDKADKTDDSENSATKDVLGGVKIGVPYAFLESLNEHAKASFERSLQVFELLGASILYIKFDVLDDASMLAYDHSTKERAIESLEYNFSECDFIVMPTDTRIVEHKKAANLMGLYNSVATFSDLSSVHVVARPSQKLSISLQLLAPHSKGKFIKNCCEAFELGCNTERYNSAAA